MYICICNPFTDKDVSQHLEIYNEKTTVRRVYDACSGGQSMNCGKCACELKPIIDQHNNTLTIKDISQKIESVPAKTGQDSDIIKEFA